MTSILELLQPRVLFAVFDPSAQEQEMLEWLNRMRIDPQAALYDMVSSTSPLHSNDPDIQSALSSFNVSGSTLASQWSALAPVAPLAWHAALASAALSHSQRMISEDGQSHQFPGEPSMSQRVTNAGYNWSSVGENIFAYGKTPLESHAAFAIDWGYAPGGIQDPPGHRQNMMSSNFREIGISIVPESSSSTDVGPLVITQDFGNRSNIGGAWLVGVVYEDGNANQRYTAGEGLSGITVQITKPGSVIPTVTTMSAGGYQALLQPGTYTITFSGGALSSPVVRTVTVSSQNVKLDYVVASDPDPDPEPAPLVVDGTSGNDTISVTLDGSNIVAITGTGTTTLPATSVTAITINGLAGNDTISIGPGVMPVTIYGGYGDDSITGGDGADLIYGDPGNDTIRGGAGNDTLSGNTEADLLYGGNGDDQIQSGLGPDTIYGDAGNDNLYAGDQTDLIYGGAGHDYIEGRGKADSISGGIGNDTIWGGAGNDTINGEDGDDWLYGQDYFSFVDMINGGNGIDRYAIDPADRAIACEVNLLA